MAANDEKIVVDNINVPGRKTRVNAAMYNAMKEAMLRVLPEKAPGLNQSEVREAVKPLLPEDLYPAGQKVGWWAKTVQLDLEAKGIILRESSKPLRWHKV